MNRLLRSLGLSHSTTAKPNAVGSTGYQPVPSGNLPDGMEGTLREDKDGQVFGRIPHSVRQVAERGRAGSPFRPAFVTHPTKSEVFEISKRKSIRGILCF